MSERLLHEAEAILAHAQTIPQRTLIETKLKDALQAAYPYSISSTELEERLGIPSAGKILAYLAMFGEVERAGHGRYRYREHPPQD